MRGGVISGVLKDSTNTGGLILENIEIIEDKKGKLSIKQGFEYFKDKAFIRGDNIIAIMIKAENKDEVSRQ